MSYIAGDAIKARRTTKSASWKSSNLGQSTVSSSYHPVVPPTVTSYGYRPAKREGPRYRTEIESGRVTSTYYNHPTTRYVSSVRDGVPRSVTAPRRHRQPYVQSYVNVNGY
eukprot:TRINITY_DN8486_c0_g1_i1.p1 TRINITY_DN8486_c0_g1~~TRINITY_DN8486_c0_g1_i1.p1  ORF type:complete len:111 (-),score=0.61 TRINITY_DN8486_c0_g1_i1:98-430(-)